MIPTNVKAGIIPRHPRERVDALAGLVIHARDLGFTKIIADPILNSPISPGMMESLEAFTMFRHEASQHPDLDVPLFIGGSNVAEMIDADSAGVNAMLAVMGVELGAAILFTSEESAKCTGSVREMRAARDMAFMARVKHAHPKDLACTALVTKRKHKAMPLFDLPADESSIIDADASEVSKVFTLDPSGVYFNLYIDQLNGRILAGAFEHDGLVATFQGTKAEAIGKSILARFDALSKDHVLYIGKELARAETCLVSGSSYIQDDE
jgi:dihydropteroate synthase-like protein